jgi:ribosomal protein S18 acetylase RimI-like enzyme
VTDLLRRARVDDLPAIARGEHIYIQEIEPHAEAAWAAAIDRSVAEWLRRLDRTLILEAEGETAGYATWGEMDGKAVLMTIHVFAEFRRGGRGSALVQAYLNDARTFGYTELALGVYHTNPIATLYEKHGFKYTHDDERGYRRYARTLDDRSQP